MIIERKIHIQNKRHGRRKLCIGECPALPEIKPCPNRKREMMVFAVVFDSWLEQGKVSDLSDISRITGLSRFMVSKIFNFRLYPTSVQLEFLEIT